MENFLKPERFDVDPTCANAENKWLHWKKTFENFLLKVPNLIEENKLPLLFNYVSANVFQSISEATSYSAAITALETLYVVKKNEIFARHCLASRNQLSNETVNEFLQVLKQLSKNCNFTTVTAETYKSEYIRDAFIRGLKNARIRERLLENSTITLENAVNQARALELAEAHSASYLTVSQPMPSAALDITEDVSEHDTLAAVTRGSCFFCGNDRHIRNTCPARNSVCHLCGKKGHFQRVCRAKPVRNIKNATAFAHLIASASPAPGCLQKSLTFVTVNGIKLVALIDTGSSLSFLNFNHVEKCNLQLMSYSGTITMANSMVTSSVAGRATVSLGLLDHTYEQIEILVMKNLCADFLIGHDILKLHSSLVINFDGSKSPLQICSLAVAEVPPVSLFSNLTPDCKPVQTKSRRLPLEDQRFISAEIRKLIEEDVIEPSNSAWRAQAFVVKGENKKPRMVIDYSQTINRYTMLDAYPLPKIEELISKVAKYQVFSKIDLKNAYHQLPILDSEKHLTAFEADGKLFQFRRVPFGVTNGVACFQRTIDQIVQAEGLRDTYPYLDDVTVCGRSQKEHDENLARFRSAASRFNLTLNEEKCNYSSRSISLLGYIIEDKNIKPDPERLKPLLSLPVPRDTASLQRALGMFAHHGRWIPSFSKKIRPLLSDNSFPLSQEAITAFQSLKDDVASASLAAIEDDIPFRVETDASDFAIGATLSQAGRPIAFFSRTLNKSEQSHSSIEKEAYAIVESLKYWRHYLIGRHFEVFTDQRSVSFMFHQQHVSKIKNEKILRWRLELACFKFDIIYRPGSKNLTADALSRVTASIAPQFSDLKDLHFALCHPGITRMFHWVRSKNLPYSITDVKATVNACHVCRELKPKFIKTSGTLIKATSAFERLNLDFKGPLPSSSKHRFLLTIIDEYSRFPFAFPCSDVSTQTVISCLQTLFYLFGMPAYIHSDRGTSFMSHELKSYLTTQGIATSRTTAYNPTGNGQVERYNGIIWKTIELALKSEGLQTNQWATMLQPALHSIRSLLCTATNETPHERLFTHPRRSHSGCSLPTWLTTPGPILMKNHNRSNKYQPIVQEVELLETNPGYAHVRLPDGRETTVNVRHLAPRGLVPLKTLDVDGSTSEPPPSESSLTEPSGTPSADDNHSIVPDVSFESTIAETPTSENSHLSSRPSHERSSLPVTSSRIRRRPAYLSDFVTD